MPTKSSNSRRIYKFNICMTAATLDPQAQFYMSSSELTNIENKANYAKPIPTETTNLCINPKIQTTEMRIYPL
ncbi:hypothetical protein PMALA_042950 [Plasmodium malariae]|uniref:Uncharacterized protein n=1 Tax=Plasmodium malariae TaxID=5858 RepID=A0A1A8WN44_PLAMA|nr:hypothetical protein PMALA_042950 [Plasmodium malariae]